MRPGSRMTSPRSGIFPFACGRRSGQEPTARMRFPEMTTAPFSMGGCETGKIVRARRIISAESFIVQSSNQLIRFNHQRINLQRLRCFRFLACLLAARGNLVLASLPLVVAFADLLLDFFGDLVNGRVKIAFDILGKKIGSAHTQANGAAKLFSGGARMVMFKRHAGVNGALVKVVEFLQLFYDMILEGLGQRDVVRRKNQLHAFKMQSAGGKIQFFFLFLATAKNGALFFFGCVKPDLSCTCKWFKACNYPQIGRALNSSHANISYAVFCLKK